MRRGRSDFFLSLSLNDFVLTLLFIILLLCLWSLKRKSDDLARCKSRCDDRQVALLEGKVKVIERILLAAGLDPFELESPEFERLVLMALKDKKRLEELDRLELEKKSLEIQTRDLQREKSDLEKRLDEAERRLAAVFGTDEHGKPRNPRELAKERQDLENRLGACVAEMRECGLGMPPCWPDPITKKPQYIFTVVIHEDGVSAISAWPRSREEDAKRIPGVSELPGELLTLAEFGRRAQPILNWSNERQCRHYVRVEDRALSKKAFRRQLLDGGSVDDYFYIYLPTESATAGTAPGQR